MESTSLHPIRNASVQNESVRLHRVNGKSFNRGQNVKWASSPNKTLVMFGTACRDGKQVTVVGDQCNIDLESDKHQHFDDTSGQQLVQEQQCHLDSPNPRDEYWRQEQEFVLLESIDNRSENDGTNYYGVQFIIHWLLKCNNGQLKVKFDSIFDALVQGLKYEGEVENASAIVVNKIVELLNEIKKETIRAKERKKMKELENGCAYIYTCNFYVCRIINKALCNNDQTMLDTLGPFCFLLYNFIGRSEKAKRTFRNRFLPRFRMPNTQFTTVYRGCRLSDQTLQKYQQAAGDNTKYFKWLQFVSTTTDEKVAEQYIGNALYKTKMRHFWNNDQATNLDRISHFSVEEETILRPGTLFQVDKLQFENSPEPHMVVYINIVPSYESILSWRLRFINNK